MRVPTKLRRHNTSKQIGAILLSPTSTYPLTTHQHSRTMRTSHMEEEHGKVRDLDRIYSKSCLLRILTTTTAATSKTECRKSGAEEI